MRSRLTSYLLLVMVAFGLVMSIVPSYASKRGRENTALALSGIAAYQLFRGHTTPGLIAGAGAVYAWGQVNKGHRHHHHYYSYRRHHHRYYG